MKRQGFTLVELILVCAIISMLMAILVPALRILQEEARVAVCSSNIRQLGMSIFTYSSDNGRFPYGFADSGTMPPSGYSGNLAFDRMGWWWFNYIERYNKGSGIKNISHCPSKKLRDPMLERNILCSNYGINQAVCKSAFSIIEDSEFNGYAMSPNGILKPSETLLTVDSGYALINWWHVTLYPPEPLYPMFIEDTSYIPGMGINSEKTIWQGQELDAIDGRHPSRTVNVGFVGGHVERMKADELQVKKTQGQYLNRYPLWSPR